MAIENNQTIDQTVTDSPPDACGVHTDCAAVRTLGEACAASGPRRGKIRASYKDLNARGKGDVNYRMAIHDDELVWIDRHPDCVGDGNRLAQGSFLASDRRDATYVEVPEGLLIVEITKSVGRGASKTSYRLGRAVWDDVGGKIAVSWPDALEHVGVRRDGSDYVHTIKIDGVRRSLRSR